MKKTLCRKNIKGHEYYYLTFRQKGVLHTSYLGKIDSVKFKRYLYNLTATAGDYGLLEAKHANFPSGLPIVYVLDGYLVYEFKNGVKELHDSKGKTVKVVYPHG